jgi:hypothetical protein
LSDVEHLEIGETALFKVFKVFKVSFFRSLFMLELLVFLVVYW